MAINDQAPPAGPAASSAPDRERVLGRGDGSPRNGAGIATRVIVLDRPGYGDSTFRSGRTILNWPNDVAEAADQLGIDRFAVLDTSGGGPYAMPCAVALLMPPEYWRLVADSAGSGQPSGVSLTPSSRASSTVLM